MYRTVASINVYWLEPPFTIYRMFMKKKKYFLISNTR